MGALQITARTKAEEEERSAAPVASTSAVSSDPRKAAVVAGAAADGGDEDNKDAIMSQALVETRRILEKRNMEIEVRCSHA